MTLIKCIHNHYLAAVSKSTDVISIRCKYEEIPRIQYHNTYIILRSSTSLSNPINPYCPNCMAETITHFTSVGWSVQDANRLLVYLRRKVPKKEKEIHDGSGCTSSVDVNIQTYNDFICTNLEELEYYLSYAWEQGLLLDDMNEYFEYTLRTTPAAKSAVDELERVDNNAAKEDSCVVCLEGIVNEEEKKKVVRMPCKHEFHEDCIVEWLSSSHVCPLCRFELPLEISN